MHIKSVYSSLKDVLVQLSLLLLIVSVSMVWTVNVKIKSLQFHANTHSSMSRIFIRNFTVCFFKVDGNAAFFLLFGLLQHYHFMYFCHPRWHHRFVSHLYTALFLSFILTELCWINLILMAQSVHGLPFVAGTEPDGVVPLGPIIQKSCFS